MPARRRKIERSPLVQVTPQVLEAFRECRRLERSCTCDGKRDGLFRECKACTAWWEKQTLIHRALRMPSFAWPCISGAPSNGPFSRSAMALRDELEKAL